MSATANNMLHVADAILTIVADHILVSHANLNSTFGQNHRNHMIYAIVLPIHT